LRVYFIHPKFSIGNSQLAEDFFDICLKEIEEYIEIVAIRSEFVMSSAEITRDDLIIFFNRSDQSYNTSLLHLLTEAKRNKADIIPIALSKDSRKPPEIVEKFQSFDIVEQLRQRSLNEVNIATVAFSFSRTIISKMQPTMTKDKMNIFITHRRLDGEEIAAWLCKQLRTRAEEVFRDLIDIQIGEDAQKIIELNLHKSDVVIFLDSPKSGQSEWVAKELNTALKFNIPIVWVKIGGIDNRSPLIIKPADLPHFQLSDIDTNDSSIDPGFVDDIIHKAFQISRESAKNIFDQIHTINNIARHNGAHFLKVDSKKMLYKVSVPRKWFSYSLRPMIHIIQCFGRAPSDKDKSMLRTDLQRLGYEDHPDHGALYDTAFLLTPTKYSVNSPPEDCITESFDQYIYCLENHLDVNKSFPSGKKGVIISGAFPDVDQYYQQYLIDAVHAFSQAIFQKQGVLIFGAHPTFQHLIFAMGKYQRPDDYQNAIRMYISKYLVADGLIEDLNKHATIIATDSVEKSREKSLTLMRQTMINDEEALALVCIGGKTRLGGHNPGVDEEIEMAKERGLPVFLIGSAGGRAAEIANEFDNDGWKEKINSLSVSDNKELMTSLDYRAMAHKILDSLKV
jgi:hypothetical protein